VEKKKAKIFCALRKTLVSIMTSTANKRYHVEYNELNGCHFNPIAELEQEENDDSTNSLIR
jgi:hypothetical protein